MHRPFPHRRHAALRALRHGLPLATLVLASCGGDSSAGTTHSPDVSANVVTVTVGAGPTGISGSNINIPYVSVTICQPDTDRCASIDHVLVDTGSWGLRLMASALANRHLTLTYEADASGNTLGECLPFASGYTWGPVATADVRLAAERADAVPVQIIDDTGSAFAQQVPASCSGNPPSLNSVGAFAANGVLGVGVRAADCGSGCENSSNNGYYFSCTASGCQGTSVAAAQQVTNPVARFDADNNGIILQLPAVAATGAYQASGTLTFGIGTRANNALASATVLTTDDSGYLPVWYQGNLLIRSFIDSGTNAVDFTDDTIAACPATYAGFYCPAQTLHLTARNQGGNGAAADVSFDVANLSALRTSNRAAYAFDNIGGGPVGGQSDSFVWGLPFFYGRSIYVAMVGQATPAGPGPYYAY